MPAEGNWEILGQSWEGRPLSLFSWGDWKGRPVFNESQNQNRETNPDSTQDSNFGPEGGTLFISGIHGDEAAAVPLLERFRQALIQEQWSRHPVAFLLAANPDGLVASSRENSRKIDLNRNFPQGWQAAAEHGEQPLSEPESKAIHTWILKNKPAQTIHLHWALAEIDPDGPQSFSLAQRMYAALTPAQTRYWRLCQTENDYPPTPLPGSLGHWIGYSEEAKGSVVALELPYTHDSEIALHPRPEGHLHSMREIWKNQNEQYLKGVYPMVSAMLRAAIEGSKI
jgi:hypothetical protein